MRARVFLSTLIVLLLMSTAARADETLAGSPPPRDETSWYGAPMLAMDGAAIVTGLAVLGANADVFIDDRPPLPPAWRGPFAGAIGVYYLASPAVHFVHGHVARGFVSLGARTFAPIVLGTLGAACGIAGTAAEGHNVIRESKAYDAPRATGFAIAYFAGLIGVSLVDDLFLAREKVAPAAARHGWLAPTVSPTRGGAELGLGGAF